MELSTIATLSTFGLLTMGAFIWSSKNESYKVRFLQKTVVIVGASAGIGRELALKYGKSRLGYNIVLVARRKELLEEIQTEIERYRANRKVKCAQGWVRSVSADICTKVGIDAIKNAVTNIKVDYLVLNAGIISCLSIEELKDKSDNQSIIHSVFDTNVFAPINLSLELLEKIKTSSTNLVIVSSIGAKTGAPRRSIYCASKHALNGYFDSFRCEMDKYGVKVTIVNPAGVATDIRKNAAEISVGAQRSTSGDPMEKSTAMTASYCAEKIFEAAEVGLREAYVPGSYGILMPIIGFFYPSLLDKVARRKYNFQ